MVRLIARGLFSYGLAGVVFAGAGYAHHSTRMFYDYDADLEIEGEVTWVFWKNPHVRFNIVRQGENGGEELWELEAGSVNTLERVGIGEETLQVGDVVRVAGPPSRRGLNTIYVSNVLFEDGHEVSLQGGQRLRWTDGSESAVPQVAASDEQRPLPDAEGIFRVWDRMYQGGSETLPFTAAAVAAREARDPLTEDPALKCIPPGMPTAMDNPYPIVFEQQGEDIVMRLEEWDGVRVIHMGTDAAAENPPSTPMGYSAGRWEDGVLVVETTHINYPFFDSALTPQSETVEIVEWFTLSDDEARLEIHMIVTDPATFTTPAESTQLYVWVPDEEIKLYECTLAE